MIWLSSYVAPAAWLAMACAYKEIYPPVGSNATTTPLYLALMMSFGGGFNSSGTVPGIKVALDRLNEDPSMLPGYTLHYTLLDSQVSGCVQCLERGRKGAMCRFGGVGASLQTKPCVGGISSLGFSFPKGSCAHVHIHIPRHIHLIYILSLSDR